MKSLYVQTFGCQMNEYDSQKMHNLLHKTHQLTLAKTPEEADVLLINTCSIREKAQEKLFHQLGRYKSLKQKNTQMIIGVGGCVASQEGAAIFKRAPYVDLIFGPQTIHKLPQMINDVWASKKPQIDISFPEIEKFDHLPIQKNTAYTAYLTIMEGCSKYCTFCVVPYTRGEEVSRPLDDILQEANILVDQGVKEITLLGQNVNAYRSAEQDAQIDFTFLLECLNDIQGLERIRFTTSHPMEFSDRLINTFKHMDKLASFVHLPVQSGSDKILMQMKRGYTAFEYQYIINQLKSARPSIGISSDFIVGFPDETDEDFEATMNMVAANGFDKSYSFIYSPRPGTPAAFFPDAVNIEKKSRRLQALQQRLKDTTNHHTQQMLGSVQRVLIESVDNHTGKLLGKTDNARKVWIQGSEALLGQMMQIKITAVETGGLQGQTIDHL